MKIRLEFLQPAGGYAGCSPVVGPEILDCSMGENPYGHPKTVLPALASLTDEQLAHYPHSHAAEDAILRLWRRSSVFARENLMLTDGSMGALYLVNNLFAERGAKVVGFVPTFTDMSANCRMLGMDFCGVPLEYDNYFANGAALEGAVDDATALVYIANPVNPTGQTIPVAALERVISRAERAGACVLVDEAYGDFIPQKESVLTVWHKYENLVVARSFSKGWGLAGLRAGFLVAHEMIMRCIAKVSHPYMVNEPARVLAAAAMEDADFPLSHAGDFIATKRRLSGLIGHNLTMLPTDDRVPICTLRHRDPHADLRELLYNAGVLTVSGTEFETLGASFVRARIPTAEDAERFLRAVEAVDRG